MDCWSSKTSRTSVLLIFFGSPAPGLPHLSSFQSLRIVLIVFRWCEQFGWIDPDRVGFRPSFSAALVLLTFASGVRRPSAPYRLAAHDWTCDRAPIAIEKDPFFSCARFSFHFRILNIIFRATRLRYNLGGKTKRKNRENHSQNSDKISLKLKIKHSNCKQIWKCSF